MITQEFYIKKYDWCVKVFYSVTRYDVEEVLRALRNIDCSRHYLRDARKNMSDGRNRGVTFTNPDVRSSVVVVGLADSGEEYYNTIVHEQTHLVIHICKAYNIDYLSEELCYLAGSIAEKMYPKVKHLICDSCLVKLRKFLDTFPYVN